MGAWRRAMVCGLGASGVAAARLLRAEGVAVLAVDERDAPEGRAAAAELSARGCEVALGARRPPEGEFDVAVASPGLPAEGPFLAELRRRGIPRMAEMELGWSRFRGRTVAVTGSNGKSSVVKALAECLEAEGRRAVPCGNYGLPVCQAVAEIAVSRNYGVALLFFCPLAIAMSSCPTRSSWCQRVCVMIIAPPFSRRW